MKNNDHSSAKPTAFAASPVGHVQATGSSAWLIPYAEQQFIAMPIAACQEIIERPEWLQVPGCADYACGLFLWHRAWLPLIDFDCLLNDKALPKHPLVSHVLVVAYFVHGQIAYGALSLPALPNIIAVREEDFCPLPGTNPHWRAWAVSCFRYRGRAVPIIDPAQLFRYPANDRTVT